MLFTSYTDHTMQLHTFNALVRDLQSHVTLANAQVLPFLGHINALLNRALVTCKAAAQVDSLTKGESLVKKEVMPAGKGFEHQWKFKKTVRPPGRKRRGLILRYMHIQFT